MSSFRIFEHSLHFGISALQGLIKPFYLPSLTDDGLQQVRVVFVTKEHATPVPFVSRRWNFSVQDRLPSFSYIRRTSDSSISIRSMCPSTSRRISRILTASVRSSSNPHTAHLGLVPFISNPQDGHVNLPSSIPCLRDKHRMGDINRGYFYLTPNRSNCRAIRFILSEVS